MNAVGMPRVIDTARLCLRWLTEDDAALMLAIWNDPAFVKHVGDRGIRTLVEARVAMKEGPMRLSRDYNYGPYSVTRQEDGERIGVCGLFRREGISDPDLGYALLPDGRRQGFAEEAGRAVLAGAGNSARLKRVLALISPGNDNSISLARKLGMKYEKVFTMAGEQEPCRVYAIDL